MRKILITLAILIAVVIVFLATWIFYGRQILLLLDRFGTIDMTSARISSIACQGNGTGGILHVKDNDSRQQPNRADNDVAWQGQVNSAYGENRGYRLSAWLWFVNVLRHCVFSHKRN